MHSDPNAQQVLSQNPMYQHMAGKEQVALTSPFAFSCRGCGHLCCIDTEVLTSPPEAARILWNLNRQPKLLARLQQNNIRWGEIFVGGSTGLPLMQLHFIPFDEAHPNKGKLCPFLAPVYDPDGKWMEMAWCGIREARPSVCRLFPLGRVSVDTYAANGNATQSNEWDYRIVARCPGFELPQESEPVPSGYEPPNPAQAVRDWVMAQCDPGQDEEKAFYLREVIPAFMSARLYAPTENNPDGILTDEQSIRLLGQGLLYNPPPPPADPTEDHTVIMAWLTFLRDNIVPELSAVCQRVFAQAEAALA